MRQITGRLNTNAASTAAARMYQHREYRRVEQDYSALSKAKRGEPDPTFASWNLVSNWLTRLDALRQVA